MQEIEIEKTYLAKYIPEGLEGCKRKELIDLYIPAASRHPVLRMRKKGDVFEMTKKSPVQEGDASHQREHTIVLSEDEFAALSQVDAKRISKVRYFFACDGRVAEIDVFREDLAGLVLVDFEFGSTAERDAFAMPDFCLVEVTQDEEIAGGMLCGKTYADIEQYLDRYGYKKIGS